jgi:uncharacterized membrane protein YccC
MREHATEDDMVAARATDLEELMNSHRAALGALPGVDPLPAQPTANQLRTYDTQHTERRRQFLAACVAYKEQVRKAVEQHQAEEDALRDRLQAPAVEPPPVKTFKKSKFD